MIKNKKIINNKFKLKTYFMKYKYLVALYLLLEILYYVCCLISVFKIADCLTQVSNNNFESAISELIFWFVILIISRMSILLSNYVYYIAKFKISLYMKKDISKRMIELTSHSYLSLPVGVFVARITKDPTNILESLDSLIFSVTELLYYSFIIIYIAFLDVWVALILAVGIIGIITIEAIRRRYQLKHQNLYKKSDEVSTSIITEVVRSEKDIKCLKMEEKLGNKINNSLYDTAKKERYYKSGITFFMDLLKLFIVIVIFVMLCFSLSKLQNGLLTLAVFMFIFTNKDALFDLGYALATFGREITSIKVSKNRIKQLFDDELFPIEKFGDREIQDCKGKIEFKNVCFNYKDTDEGNEKELFNDLSLTIEPNSTIAIVGKSGSGKSTIMNLIAKLYEVQKGSIEIDGINIKDLTKDSLRNTITMVNQFPYIFDASIKENLLMAKPTATDEELIEVIKKASLADLINSLPNKLDTNVGESGTKLSGGQRQRLAIARALLKDSKIILFDESTSALDNFAQHDIQNSIEALSGERTIIIVAHRLSTIKNAQKIFFIKEGKINGEGTFEELFENNQDFREMFLVENI